VFDVFASDLSIWFAEFVLFFVYPLTKRLYKRYCGGSLLFSVKMAMRFVLLSLPNTESVYLEHIDRGVSVSYRHYVLPRRAICLAVSDQLCIYNTSIGVR